MHAVKEIDNKESLAIRRVSTDFREYELQFSLCSPLAQHSTTGHHSEFCGPPLVILFCPMIIAEESITNGPYTQSKLTGNQQKCLIGDMNALPSSYYN